MTAHNPFWIQTRTRNGTFDLSNPRAADVRLEDIAHALSQLCRFTGHCSRFYSVAQHSIHVAELVAKEHPEWALAALLHDAEEAYIGDLSSPLKALLRNNGAGEALKNVSRTVQRAIEKRFDLLLLSCGGPTGEFTRHAAIKAADLKMLATERRDLMPSLPAADEAGWFAATGVAPAEPCSWHIPQIDARLLPGAFIRTFINYGGKL